MHKAPAVEKAEPPLFPDRLVPVLYAYKQIGTSSFCIGLLLTEIVEWGGMGRCDCTIQKLFNQSEYM